jgi:hypothetical protein
MHGRLRVRSRFAALAALCSFALFMAAAAGPPAVAAAAPSEYQLKAVFLFNFAQFVEWPAAAFQDADVPLVIGILGNDPFDGYLDEVVHGEQVKGRPLIVKRFRRLEDVDVCHILFVGSSDAARLASGQAALSGRAILTVSDAERPGQPGAMIQFVDAQKHIRLRIDVDTAAAAGLTISSKLLRSAEIVRARGG